ncbi:MAG TPA: VOC family protein [Terracidiphilus sp.]|jgi:catechol 2,3-dioxygenase-like lactoylglutathione lyase family enzyme|nr:VOC family protein [Terracidiphilus sp.]
MDRVVTFLLTQKPEAAIAFFRDVLGFLYLRDDGFALVFDLRGVMLRIAKVDAFTPVPSTVLGWESLDIAADVARLAAKGVRFEIYPNLTQDQQGICTFPGGSRVAWFKDPDGNVLSLSQHAA